MTEADTFNTKILKRKKRRRTCIVLFSLRHEQHQCGV